tara:strand:- start:1579 stop:1734 length:156 start_codon:yes stop_codon:yes gene_type:complete
MSYKLNKVDECGDKLVIRLSDGAFIPFDERNADYQEYLEWVKLGNTPQEAD